MNNRDIFTGYLAGRAIANNVSYELQKYRMDLEKQGQFWANYVSEEKLSEVVGRCVLTGNIQRAYDYLNGGLKNEFVTDCLNQKVFKEHLSVLIENRRAKYLPFYEKIGRQMPQELRDMTAESLCEIMGVELMSEEALEEYHRENDREEAMKEFWSDLGLIFRVILIVGLIVLCIVATAD